jgi:hypothetical protein
MKQYYFYIPDNSANSDNVVFTIDTATAQFVVEAVFDRDSISETYNKWIFRFNRILDNEKVEERAIVCNPNSVYFPYDEIYSVILAIDKETIAFEDLSSITVILAMRKEDE